MHLDILFTPKGRRIVTNLLKVKNINREKCHMIVLEIKHIKTDKEFKIINQHI